MQCPIDGTQLVLAERAGVEIDYCPQCRGVWLDRGELDKIIDRSASAVVTAAPMPGARDQHAHGERPRKKRGGFLEDLFDF
jgi:hypothetical protein